MAHLRGARNAPIQPHDQPLIHLWFPVLLWLALISYFSSRSALPPPFSFRSKLGTFCRYSAHFGEFAILAALLHRALSGSGKRRTTSAPADPSNPPNLTGNSNRNIVATTTQLPVTPALSTTERSEAQASFSVRHSSLVVFVTGLLFAILDELHQSFVPNRQFELADIACDAAGMIAVLGLIRTRDQPRPSAAERLETPWSA